MNQYSIEVSGGKVIGDSVFFRSYGSMWRKALDAFDQMFVQSEESRDLLHHIGFDNVIVAGDTRFDRVAAIAKAAKPVDIVARFKGDAPLFVAGSTWGPDEDILLPLINANPAIRFVIAPHEMEEARINKILQLAQGGAKRYAEQAGVPFLGEIPLIQTIMEGGECGTPTVETDTDVERYYRLVAERMISQLFK